jgi:hypothetical protein
MYRDLKIAKDSNGWRASRGGSQSTKGIFHYAGCSTTPGRRLVAPCPGVAKWPCVVK